MASNEQWWCCEICQKQGFVQTEPGGGAWTVVQKIFSDHRRVSPDCNGGGGDIRLVSKATGVTGPYIGGVMIKAMDDAATGRSIGDKGILAENGTMKTFVVLLRRRFEPGHEPESSRRIIIRATHFTCDGADDFVRFWSGPGVWPTAIIPVERIEAIVREEALS